MNRGNSKNKKLSLPAYAGSDWGSYDRFLVARGQKLARLFMDMKREMERNWEKELARMNHGKRGRPYTYPDSFMVMMIIINQILRLPLRILEGYASEQSDHKPDSSTLSRRFRKLEYRIRKRVRNILKASRKRVIELAMDGTGIRLGGAYVWREEKWGKVRRNFGKIVVALDIHTGEIVSWMAGRSNFHEGVYSRISYLMEESSRYGRVEKVYGDAAYANSKAIRDMIRKGVEPVIKVRKPIIQKALRDGIWDEIHALGIAQSNWKCWVKRKHYGKRSAVEGIIGSFKRIFGEISHAVKWFESEMNARILLWNVMYTT